MPATKECSSGLAPNKRQVVLLGPTCRAFNLTGGIMLGLVGRKRLEEAEAETRMLLAHFTEAVAAAQQAVASHQHTMARYNELLVIVNDWQRMYDEQATELRQARAACDLAWWTLRTPGTENIGPPTCIGEYIEGGH